MRPVIVDHRGGARPAYNPGTGDVYAPNRVRTHAADARLTGPGPAAPAIGREPASHDAAVRVGGGYQRPDREGPGPAETGPAELHPTGGQARVLHRQPRIPGGGTQGSGLG